MRMIDLCICFLQRAQNSVIYCELRCFLHKQTAAQDRCTWDRRWSVSQHTYKVFPVGSPGSKCLEIQKQVKQNRCFSVIDSAGRTGTYSYNVSKGLQKVVQVMPACDLVSTVGGEYKKQADCETFFIVL